MNPLQEWKKAKKAELDKIWGVNRAEGQALPEKLETFLDTSFDELIALVEREVILGPKKIAYPHTPEKISEQRGWDERRAKELKLLSRLRGETNDQSV